MALLAENRAKAKKEATDGQEDGDQKVFKKPASKAKSKPKAKAKSNGKGGTGKRKPETSVKPEASEPPKKKGRPQKKPAAAQASLVPEGASKPHPQDGVEEDPAIPAPAPKPKPIPCPEANDEAAILKDAPHTFARRAKPSTASGLQKYARIAKAFRDHIQPSLDAKNKTSAEDMQGLATF